MPRAAANDDPLFTAAVARLLRHEGGFVDDPNDGGRATNFGVSLVFARAIGDSDGDGWADFDLDRDGDVDAEDIRRMTRAQAIEAYRIHFWEKYGYERLTLFIGAKVLDVSVNMGPGQGHRVLQRALRSCGWPVVEDGKVGPATVAACRDANDIALAASIRSEAAAIYRLIVARVPSQERFLKGWLRRAYDEPHT